VLFARASVLFGLLGLAVLAVVLVADLTFWLGPAMSLAPRRGLLNEACRPSLGARPTRLCVSTTPRRIPSAVDPPSSRLSTAVVAVGSVVGALR
jgi:hypothetical protein